MDPFLPAGGRKRPPKPAALSESPATTVLSSLTPDAPVFFRTSLLFPADEHVRAFGPNRDDPRPEWDDEGNEYLPVGEIAVTIRTGERYAIFEYAAVTSSMSDLFERSRAIWRQFDAMLRASGGLVAIFAAVDHRGPAEYPVLPDGRQAVTLDFFDYILEERDTYWHIDVDRYASAVLQFLRMEA